MRQMKGMGKMNRLGYNKAGILTRIKRERKGQGRERERIKFEWEGEKRKMGNDLNSSTDETFPIIIKL